MNIRQYAAIDLKSFYASCECVDRELDPLTTNLVVADASRTSKTICLAVSPGLKSFGVPGRPRLFEVEARVREINALRLHRAPGHRFAGTFTDIRAQEDPSLALDYLVAVPRMARYMELSTRIYSIYLRYVAPEDIFAYSIDEVFIDLTPYLSIYASSAHALVISMIRDVLSETGITATAGIGTNLFLAKVAMDVVAKHASADADGVRIAELDERSYREQLWAHDPITDIWRVGRGTARKLREHGIYTMGDVARASLSQDPYRGEPLLYRLFGVNAELLIDHAWGYEPCTLADVKAYVPEDKSLGSGQVLPRPYAYDETALVVREMTDLLVMELVEKGLACDAIDLTVNYDVENLDDPVRRGNYRGPVVTDFYGRRVPKPAHGSERLGSHTSSTRTILRAMTALFRRIVDPSLTVRRIVVTAQHTIREEDAGALRQEEDAGFEQLDLFTDYGARERQREEAQREEERERELQQALLDIKRRYGKNAVLRGMNLQKGATAVARNRQVGGHRA